MNYNFWIDLDQFEPAVKEIPISSSMFGRIYGVDLNSTSLITESFRIAKDFGGIDNNTLQFLEVDKFEPTVQNFPIRYYIWKDVWSIS